MLNATNLNGKVGRVVVVPKNDSPEGRAGVRFVDHAKPKAIKIENLEPVDLKRHLHFEDRDIPGLEYLSPRDGTPIQIRIENGRGKNCSECGLDLENQYHVLYDGDWLCDEDYVRKYVGHHHIRICTLCHKYIPLRQLNALPGGVMNSFYPDGKLPNGLQVGMVDDRSDSNSNGLIFFAHDRCFTCHLCGTPMYMSEINTLLDLLCEC